MKVKVIGIQPINYVNKTGRQITGTKLHCAYEKDSIRGLAVDSFYLGNNIPNVDKIKLNDTVNLYFDQYGKVDFLAQAE